MHTARLNALDEMLKSAQMLYPFTSNQLLLEECKGRLANAIGEAERIAKQKVGYEIIAHQLCQLQIEWTTAAILAIEILLSQGEDKPSGA